MKPKIIILLIISMYALNTAYAQKTGRVLLDSLKKELTKTKDLEQIDVMVTIAFELRSNNPDSSLYFSRKALQLSNERNYKLGVSNAYLTIGIALENKGKYDSALHYSFIALDNYNQLIKIGKQQPNNELISRKTRAYINIGIIMYDKSNFPEALENYDRALQIAETLKDTANLAIIYNNIGNVHKAQSRYVEAIQYYQQSLAIRKKAGNKKGIAESYQNLGITYKAQGKYLVALSYFDSSLVIRQEISDKKGIADLWNNKGNTYKLLGKYPEAIECITYGMHVRKEINDLRGIAGSYNNMGTIHFEKNNYPAALQNYFNALKIQEEIGNKKGIADANLNIGNVYYSLHSPAEALRYYNLALKIREETGDKQGLAAAYGNIGAVYFDDHKYLEALGNLDKALKIQLEVDDPEGAAISYTSIGTIMGLQKNYTAALDNLFEGLKIAQEIKDKSGLADANIKIAVIYMKQNKTHQALEYLQKGMQFANELGSNEFLKNGYEIFATVDSIKGNYKQAYIHYKAYIQNRDAIFNQDTLKRIVQIQMQDSISKREDSLSAVHKKEIAVEKEINRGQRKTGATLALSATLLFAGSFVFYSKKQQDKNKMQALQTRNEKLELQRDASKAQLNSHFVTDTIAYINEFIENGNNDAASRYVNKLSRMIRSMLQNSFEKRKTTLKEETDFVENFIQLMQLQYPDNHIRYSIGVSNDIDINRCLIPPMILQVLVDNAIRHGLHEKGGNVQVSITRRNNYIHCVVEDNGLGREAARLKSKQNRKSFGTNLAEELVKLWNTDNEGALLVFEDLKDANGNATGTKAGFSFPETANLPT